MQILIPDSWLREFVKTTATPREIQTALSLCSASVDRLHKVGNDYVYDIEITTNRVDLMSVLGIAQEAAAILPAKLLTNPLKTKTSINLSKTVDYLKVKVDPKLCLRFTAILIQGVSVKPSPSWLVKRLELVGMRGLNDVVDISNYLMHELGQPVHTFDYDKIVGHTMNLRPSRKGEKITTLDGKIHSLSGDDIVIEDGSKKLIDLCGIMGGANSAVDQNTKNVLLFVQTYEPTHIRKTSMNLAHRTAAAVLFEKGLPVENVLPTLQQGITLFKKLTGGQIVSPVIDILNTKPTTKHISLDFNFINTRLGISLSPKQITDILSRLGFLVKRNIVTIPPRRRLDITLPEDLVEEVARVYGYHNLPSKLMTGPLPTIRNDRSFYWETKIKSALSHWGFTETYTYSLVSKNQGLKLKNPLSLEWKYLRTQLTSSHLKVIEENLGRFKQLDLFEIANVYLPRKNDLPIEELHLVISSTNLDVTKFKGFINALSDEIGVSIIPDIKTHSSALTFETNLVPLITAAANIKTYVPISKFPPIIEDINVKLSGSYADLTVQIKKISSLIKQIDLIDKYGNKLTLRITYHSNHKQLSSIDIEPIRERLKAWAWELELE